MPDTGIAALDDLIERLKRVGGPAMPAEAAKAIAPLVEKECKRTAAAGTTPLGEPWKPKKDGGRPLAHAADHIRTEAQGDMVTTTLEGPDVFHHKGLGGKPHRQVLPDRTSISPQLRKVIVDGARKAFHRLLGVAP